MHIVVANNRAPWNLQPIQLTTHHRVRLAAAIIRNISGQKYEANRISKCPVHFIHYLRQVKLILLTSLRHMQIAKMDPANHASGVRDPRLKRMLHLSRMHSRNFRGARFD